MPRQRKSNPQLESGTQSLHKIMMPDQISGVLQDIDSMLAEANKTIDQSLLHSAQLVEQAQHQLMARHQHLMDSPLIEPATKVTAQQAEIAGTKVDNLQSPPFDAGHHSPESLTAEDPVASGAVSIAGVSDTNAAQSATAELEKVLQSTAEAEQSLRNERQQLIAKQQHMQQTSAAAQKSIESAMSNISQGLMRQQQAYEQVIMAKANALEQKSEAAASAISQSPPTGHPDNDNPDK